MGTKFSRILVEDVQQLSRKGWQPHDIARSYGLRAAVIEEILRIELPPDLDLGLNDDARIRSWREGDARGRAERRRIQEAERAERSRRKRAGKGPLLTDDQIRDSMDFLARHC